MILYELNIYDGVYYKLIPAGAWQLGREVGLDESLKSFVV